MLSRADGHSDFIKMVVNASRLQVLNDNFSLLTAAAGHSPTCRCLRPSSSAMAASPSDATYDPSQISGDEGMAGSLELRYNNALSEQIGLQPYLFYDIGKMWGILDTQQRRVPHSAGFGIRSSSIKTPVTVQSVSSPGGAACPFHP